MYPDKFQFHNEYFDKVMGTATIRSQLEKAMSVAEIVKGYEPGLKTFSEERESYLLYK
jgi:uncharacterized protein YbbC (DUF1343 family)